MKARYICKAQGVRSGMLWCLSKTYTVKEWDGTFVARTRFVITSGIDINFPSSTHLPPARETYVFPANRKGEVIDWTELPGSFRGAVDHERAIDGFLDAVS